MSLAVDDLGDAKVIEAFGAVAGLLGSSEGDACVDGAALVDLGVLT